MRFLSLHTPIGGNLQFAASPIYGPTWDFSQFGEIRGWFSVILQGIVTHSKIYSILMVPTE